MSKIEYVASGCLAGLCCRYDGRSNPCAAVVKLCEEGRAIPICPETYANLPVPREPCEQKNGRVISRDGRDLTEDFIKGAEMAVRKAKEAGAAKAILKARSPSCGFGEIYDGSFSRVLCPGNGICAEMLLAEGFQIYTEENLPENL